MGATNINARIPSETRFGVTSETLVKAYPNDQIALVHIRTRRIQILNRTASRVWKLLASGNSRGEIERLLGEEFETTDQITSEIDGILNLLAQEGLISFQE